MTAGQRATLDAMVRTSPLDLKGDVTTQRGIFGAMMADIPIPDDVVVTETDLAGVPALKIKIDHQPGTGALLYFHGGAYAIGTAQGSVPLASELARRARATVYTVDYRLAPEHPFPAGRHDAVTAYQGLLATGISPTQVIVAGESAGGGMALGLLADLTATKMALPAGGYLMSPWVDLGMTGRSIHDQQDHDPALTRHGLQLRAADYIGNRTADDPAVSPLFADLTTLPPLLIQVGGNEILLDDATRLATSAAAQKVDVTLQVTADVPHVFQAFWPQLTEADQALQRGAEFIREQLDIGA